MMDNGVSLIDAAPDEQASVAHLASLLEISIELAHKALRQSQWNLERAVDAACQLVAASGAAAAGPPQLGVGHTSASSRGQACNSRSSAPSVPRKVDSVGDRRFEDNQLASMSSAATASVGGFSSASSSSRPSMPSGPSLSCPAGRRTLHSSLADGVPDVFVAVGGPAEKKRRLSATSSTAMFKIPNNNADQPAANPPLFQAHPLREEQRRSLSWMISREASQGQSDHDALLTKGGLLADRMGYGKTSTTIGLLSRDVDRTLYQPGQNGTPRLTHAGYIPSDSTLIVCPSHLVDQWQGEFWKFLGSSGVELSRPIQFDSRNMERFTVTFKFQDASLSHRDFGIRVEKTPSSWRAQHPCPALITDIDVTSLRNVMRCCGVQQEIRRGDMISKVECKNLHCSGTVYTNRSHEISENVATHARSSFPQIHDLFCGGFTVHRRVHSGYYSAEDGRQVKIMRSVSVPLKIKAGSTIAFTIARMNSSQRTEVVKGGGPLKVLTIRSTADLELLQQRDLISQFHVVLASAGIHADLKYAEYVKQSANQSGLMEKKLDSLRKQVRVWCESRDAFETALTRFPPIFEVVFWRRVVLDEFHESEAWEYRVREMLRSLGAIHKWGLSGTPPLSNTAAVVEVAGLLGCTMPCKDGGIFEKALYYGSNTRSAHPNSTAWFEANQLCLQEAAAKFVQEHIRQNASELVEQIGVVEHEELVDHTSEERLIYRQACHDQGIFDLADGYSHISLLSREVLLKRCAHFDMGEAVESATAAVTRLGDKKTGMGGED
eukprot:gnl/TRDRNA2_/TRDRNA2_173490_c2_seq10.p1 gnl/TRDRNA2_/TRDRNA2_173490_c2~~gnl/TRDRNA2_/TRDRNA2_173490_c2_seq10.p1  ORF type:complete len:784 (-),score=89.47 gnl/TRDRNA2_/TRDRNA2_173490_c2_seq10:1572-3902(-)